MATRKLSGYHSIIFFMAVFLMALFPLALSAQTPAVNTPIENTAPPTPIGSGARSLGYGGAFIAIADDATSASWNPGGLVQLLYPESSMVIDYRTQDVDDDYTDFLSVNFMSLAYPFNIEGTNVVVALAFQQLYDFYFEGDFNEQSNFEDASAAIYRVNFYDPLGGPGFVGWVSEAYTRYDTTKTGMKSIQGQVGALSPAVAVQVTPELSVGFTYNFWADGMVGRDYKYEYEHDISGSEYQEEQGWLTFNDDCTCHDDDGDPVPCENAMFENVYLDNPSCLDSTTSLGTATGDVNSFASHHRRVADIGFEGQNFNVGIMYKPTPRITLGAVYRSEFEADVHLQETRYYTNRVWNGVPQPDLGADYIESYDKMRFPASYGAGVAFRYSDALTMAFDATMVEWDRFVYTYENGEKISLINGLPEDMADIDPTVTYRLGGEYLFIKPNYVVPIRGGLFYDPEPARGEQDDYYGASFGLGLAYKQLIVDMAYWYRWGNDVLLYTTYDPITMQIHENRGDVAEQMIMLSAIIHLQ